MYSIYKILYQNGTMFYFIQYVTITKLQWQHVDITVANEHSRFGHSLDARSWQMGREIVGYRSRSNEIDPQITGRYYPPASAMIRRWYELNWPRLALTFVRSAPIEPRAHFDFLRIEIAYFLSLTGFPTVKLQFRVVKTIFRS